MLCIGPCINGNMHYEGPPGCYEHSDLYHPLDHCPISFPGLLGKPTNTADDTAWLAHLAACQQCQDTTW